MITYALTDLIDSEILQQLQDGFAKYTGLDIVVVNEFIMPVTKTNDFEKIENLILESPTNEKKSSKIKNEFYKKLVKGKSVSFKDSENIFYVVSPIMVEEKLLGLIICSGLENVENIEEFISSIAKVFSKIAYENYVSQNNSQVMRLSTQKQGAAITETALKLKKYMQEWSVIISEALEKTDLAIIKENLKLALGKSTDFYSFVDYYVREILDKTESVSLLETEYNLRHLITREISQVQKHAEKKLMAFSYEIDGAVPHFLFGDIERILKIIFRLLKNSAERIRRGRVNMEISCEDVSYAKMLLIKYTDSTNGFAEGDLDALQMFNATGDESYLKKSSALLYDYTVINLLVQQLYGAIDFNVLGDNKMEFIIKIPQLEIEVEELEN